MVYKRDSKSSRSLPAKPHARVNKNRSMYSAGGLTYVFLLECERSCTEVFLSGAL